MAQAFEVSGGFLDHIRLRIVGEMTHLIPRV